MAIDFPSSGLVANSTTYQYGGRTWLWNGTSWEVYAGNDGPGRPAAHSATHEAGSSDEARGRRTLNVQTGNYTVTSSDYGVFRAVAINSSSPTTVTAWGVS